MNIAQQASAKEARPIAEDDVRTRAYAIWEDEGRPHGRHLDHWRRAIDEVSPPATTVAQNNDASAADKRAAKAKTEGAIDEVVAPKAPKKAATPNNDAKPAARRTAKPKTSNGVEARAR